MPSPFRLARVLVTLQILLLLALLIVQAITAPPASMLACVVALASCLALAGLWRGVVWGRGLCSGVVIYETLATLVLLFPDQNIPASSQQLGKWLSQELPTGLHIFLIMLLGALQLAPLVMLGWNRDWFRRAIW